MQPTGSSLMRRLSSAIHPQLPLDARQTEQLLRALTTSFQRHLDTLHPTATTPSTIEHRTNSFQPSHGFTRGASSFVKANKHFDSIITHPTFAGSAIRISPELDSMERAALSSFNLFRNHLKHATLTPVIVSNCIQTMASLAPQKTRELGLCYKITTLIRTTDQISLNDILSVRETSATWTSLMFEEGQEHYVWNLIMNDRTLRPDNTDALLLYSYVFNAFRKRGFAFTLDKIIAATNDCQLRDRLTAKLLSSMVLLSRKLLTKSSTLQAVSLEEYDSLASRLSALHITTEHTHLQQLLCAVMQLIHPKTPDPALMKEYIEHLGNSVEDFRRATVTKTSRETLLHAIFRTASLNFSRGNYKDAQSMLHFAQSHFPEELPEPTSNDVLQPESKQQSSELNDNSILSRLDGILAT